MSLFGRKEKEEIERLNSEIEKLKAAMPSGAGRWTISTAKFQVPAMSFPE